MTPMGSQSWLVSFTEEQADARYERLPLVQRGVWAAGTTLHVIAQLPIVDRETILTTVQVFAQSDVAYTLASEYAYREWTILGLKFVGSPPLSGGLFTGFQLTSGLTINAPTYVNAGGLAQLQLTMVALPVNVRYEIRYYLTRVPQ